MAYGPQPWLGQPTFQANFDNSQFFFFLYISVALHFLYVRHFVRTDGHADKLWCVLGLVPWRDLVDSASQPSWRLLARMSWDSRNLRHPVHDNGSLGPRKTMTNCKHMHLLSIKMWFDGGLSATWGGLGIPGTLHKPDDEILAIVLEDFAWPETRATK